MRRSEQRANWPPTLWAAVTPPGPALSPLSGDATADVVVIGAGFSGLGAALELTGQGADVLVLEAAEPGWGASGRNNGQVIPTLTRPEPDDIEKRHGAAGERFVALLRDSAANLFEVIRDLEIAAEAEQTGWIQPVHSPGRMKIAEKRVEQWKKRGAPVRLYSSDEMVALTGSRFWHGGWGNPTGGHINPLALTRGLAGVVAARGGRIAVHTAAISIAQVGGRWQVLTPRGTVTSRALILASNAYTSEFAPGIATQLEHEVVPVRSWQMATRPLSDEVRRTILPGRQALSDTHGDLHFCRYDARNRLVTGGALMIATNGAARLKSRIGARLKRMFPEVGDISFDYVWNGYVGMTVDFLPRVHRLGPNGYAWIGCNGRAVGLGFALGRELARAVMGVPEDELALPFSDPAPLPVHAILRRLAPLRLIEYRWRDAREIP